MDVLASLLKQLSEQTNVNKELRDLIKTNGGK